MNSRVIFLALVFLLVILVVRIISFYDGVSDYPQGSQVTWQTRVLAQPKLKPNGQQVTLNMPNHQRVVVRFGLLPQIGYGDTVNVRGEVDYFGK